MVFHTGSLVLASVGMFEILMSFPSTFFIYRLIFQIGYFSSIQILSIFVVLGIGADDIFVFVDSFKVGLTSCYHKISSFCICKCTKLFLFLVLFFLGGKWATDMQCSKHEKAILWRNEL